MRWTNMGSLPKSIRRYQEWVDLITVVEKREKDANDE